MKKWGIGFIIVLLFCIPIFLHRETSQQLLKDTDTHTLVEAIRARNAPLSWFTGDWPLQNHFYRPLPTLAFELDNYLYKDNAPGYGATNALLAIACVLLLFWFLREFTNNPVLSSVSSCLFACWVSGSWFWQASAVVQYGSYVGLLVALYLLFQKPIPWPKVRVAVAAFLTLFFASSEVFGATVSPVEALSQNMIAWLPSRTVSVMVVFALLAMASYARYERVSAVKIQKEITPLTPPATKGTAITKATKTAWLWAVVAVIGTALAFCSYEQAVMLPAALLGVAIAMRLQGYKSRWGWQAAFWLCLVGYMLVRKELLPPGNSDYQKQTLRFGPGVLLTLERYAFPYLAGFWESIGTLSTGLALLLMSDIYVSGLFFIANVTAYVESRRRFVLAFTGWSLSIITFLPMAWLRGAGTPSFEYYNFWPLAFRSLFAVVLCWIGVDLLVIAVSPPELKAPARLNPAPGSLPRP
ncbi:MAG TPA: hypothetical protein VGL56_06250 [Fimbriimonadaceae bacterium]